MRNGFRALLLLGMCVALALAVNAQQVGIYSSWSVNTDNGEIYAYAQTWTDYNSGYYYDVQAEAEVWVQPTPGAWYNLSCDNFSNPETVSADTSCDVFVDPSFANLEFNSVHSVWVPYYVSQFEPDCSPDECGGYYDAFAMSLLGVNGQYGDNTSWNDPGYFTPAGQTQTLAGQIVRVAAGPCPSPSGEDSSYLGKSDPVNGPDAGWLSGEFSGNLHPDYSTYSFNGRNVTEILSNFSDGCWYPGNGFDPSTQGPEGTWSVNFYNSYGADWIGFTPAYVSHYQSLISNGQAPYNSCNGSNAPPPAVSFTQQMAIYCGNALHTYDPGHSLGYVIYGGSTTAYRASASGPGQ